MGRLSAWRADERIDAGQTLVARLRDRGFEAYWAGGCVRDLILGQRPKDIDVATSAKPDEVLRLFPGSHAVGKAFGVVRVRIGEQWIETATFRRDVGATDGRHPDRVEFADAREDAERRDFTINGMFYDPLNDEIIDYVGGQADLGARRIRAIGDPASRFTEDYLRMLRAVRFASVLGFVIDTDTARAIRQSADRIACISAERIQQEFTRILMESPSPSAALRLLADLDLLRHILPEVDAMRGTEQAPEYHPEGDVFVHTGIMLDSVEGRTPELMYAVLLHDVGKPPTFRIEPQSDGRMRIRFDGHDKVGAEMAERILQRLRLSNDFTETVCHAVARHMRFMHVQEMREGKVRQLIGAPTFELEMELHRVDCLSSHRNLGNYEFLRRFKANLDGRAALPAPFVTGRDLLDAGMKSGPAMGALLKSLYEAQLDGELKDREAALARVKAQSGTPATGQA